MVSHHPHQPLHALEVLENLYESRPQMRIRFFEPRHFGVSQIQMVHPRHGDVFYLRALLIHCSAHSWKDLKTINGTTYPTFRQAACAFGLFEHQNEATIAFCELLDIGAPPTQLRSLFSIFASEGEPVMNLWNDYQMQMSTDTQDHLLQTEGCADPDVIFNRLLITLEDLLHGFGTSLSDVGLPQPINERLREVDTEQLQWGGDPGNLCYESLSLYLRLVLYHSRK